MQSTSPRILNEISVVTKHSKEVKDSDRETVWSDHNAEKAIGENNGESCNHVLSMDVCPKVTNRNM